VFTGLDFLAHWHEDIELVFITAGQQCLGINQRQLTLTAGSAVLIAPSDIHYYSKPDKVDGFMFICPAELIGHDLPNHSMHWQIGSTGKLETLTRLASQLVHEMTEREPYYELAAQGFLHLVITHLMRPDQAVACINLDRADHPRTLVMQDILAYLDENFRETIGRDTVTDRFHLSAAHFTRTFKAATGLTFTEYLTQLRLENACHDIGQTYSPITEIALNNGFSSIRTFNRLFRKVLHKTPSSLR
jgi:AraC-like DNA-binding protein